MAVTVDGNLSGSRFVGDKRLRLAETSCEAFESVRDESRPKCEVLSSTGLQRCCPM
jgi:hypothetical protein